MCYLDVLLRPWTNGVLDVYARCQMSMLSMLDVYAVYADVYAVYARCLTSASVSSYGRSLMRSRC